MRNKFPGACYRCNQLVKAGEGHFEKIDMTSKMRSIPAFAHTKWLLQHADCAIKHRGTEHIDETYLKEHSK